MLKISIYLKFKFHQPLDNFQIWQPDLCDLLTGFK